MEESQTLSAILGCSLSLKFESLQFTASYKERGALNKLLSLTAEQRRRGVVAVSAGNHAQAVARHAQLLGIRATIVMPATTPFVKVSRTRLLGAEVELVGQELADAMKRGHELVDEGLVFIHPYDDPHVIAGQGTVAVEMLEQQPDLEVLVIPVGGGGLISGCAIAAKSIKPDIRIVGVQTEAYPSMWASFHGTEYEPYGQTIAEGIAVATPGEITAPIVSEHVDEFHKVSELQIEDAVNLTLDIEKVVVEGAGAAGIAAISANPGSFAGKRVGVVLTGGNIDPRLLSAVIQRGLVRSGRLARLRVEINDRPGALASLLAVIAEAGANLIEVSHQRVFANVPLRLTEVEITVECVDSTHRDSVVTSVNAAGYKTRLLGLDAV